MADHRKTVYASSARSKCDDLELPMINNSSHHCCHDRGGIHARYMIGDDQADTQKNRCTLTLSGANRQRITEKHVIKLGKGRNVYG